VLPVSQSRRGLLFNVSYTIFSNIKQRPKIFVNPIANKEYCLLNRSSVKCLHKEHELREDWGDGVCRSVSVLNAWRLHLVLANYVV
jgi:hypothetical protein